MPPSFTFLKLNGRTLKVPSVEFEKVARSVAEGKADKPAVAAFFRIHARA